MSKVKVIAIRAPGTNCDAEAVFAFQQAGAEVDLVHINRLIGREKKLADELARQKAMKKRQVGSLPFNAEENPRS